MTYRVYRFRERWEELGIKHNVYDALKVIGRDLDPEFDIHYVVIENDGKSDFPIMSINTLQQYYDFVEQFLGKKDEKGYCFSKKICYNYISKREKI